MMPSGTPYDPSEGTAIDTQSPAGARALVLEAAKARKAVELLREKQFEEFTTEQKRREFASLDDLMVMRSRREGVSDDTSMEDAA